MNTINLPFLDEALKQIDGKRAMVASWRPTAEAAQRAVDAAGTALKFRLQVGYELGALHGILIMAEDVTDLRLMVPLLRALRKEGYRVKNHTDWKDVPSRTYDLEALNAEEPKGPIAVRALFPWDELKAAAASCRFVQTGTKEVPTYEVICGGEKAPELEEEIA